MPNRFKYACIGAGGIANKKHLNEYSKLNDIEIAAICDLNKEGAQKLALKYNIPKVYTDYKEMFAAEKLDIISICTPNYLHAPICIDALRAGIHVHCEKPLAINADEIRNIIDEKNRSGKKLMVALNNRFTSETVLIRKLVEQGYFGKLYHAKCGWKRNSGIPGIGRWFTSKKYSGGGALIDLGVHFLDLALYFMEYPKLISVSGAVYSNFKADASRIRAGYKSAENGVFDVEDTAVGFVRLENDATIEMDFSWASNIEKEVKYVELLGTKGGASFVNGEITLYSQQEGVCFKAIPDVKTISQELGECHYLVDCIVNNREPMASAEEAYELMRAIDAFYISAALKREVPLSPDQ